MLARRLARSAAGSLALTVVVSALGAGGCTTDVVVAPAPAPEPDAAEAPPPAQCKPGAPAPAGAWFTDVTEEVGLGGVVALRVSSADLDGDGLPDLVLHTMPNKRDTADAPSKRVFMNRGGRFEDTTLTSGLMDSRDGPGTGRLSHFSVFADVDNDGDLDLFDGAFIDSNTDPTAKKDVSEIYLNDGKGNFTRAPSSAPSYRALPMSGASFVDYDRDGIVDLFVGTFYDGAEGAGNFLFHGLGAGVFDDASLPTKVMRPETFGARDAWLRGENRRPAYGVTVCDIDDDGDPDLIVSAYGRGYNELWRNDGGVFTEIGMGTPFAADANTDYKSDNGFYQCWCSQNPGKCPESESKPVISCDRISWTPGFDDQPARNGGNTFTTACGDIDNDGDMDIIHAEIRHWHIGGSSDPSQIIKNDLSGGAPSWTRVPNDAKGLLRKPTRSDWNEGDMDVGMVDFDNDGLKDIWLSSSDYPDTWGSLFHQNPDGSFTDVTDVAGAKHYHAHAFAAVDIDGDGDLDLIVATSNARCSGDPKCAPKPVIRVFRNDIGSANNHVKVRLHGKGAGGSNAAGIGAKVTVVSGGVKQVQEVGGGYGHFGLQHDTVLTFGLGGTCAIDEIQVRWPDGKSTVQTFKGVVANYLVDLTEGEELPKYKR